MAWILKARKQIESSKSFNMAISLNAAALDTLNDSHTCSRRRKGLSSQLRGADRSGSGNWTRSGCSAVVEMLGVKVKHEEAGRAFPYEWPPENQTGFDSSEPTKTK